MNFLASVEAQKLEKNQPTGVSEAPLPPSTSSSSLPTECDLPSHTAHVTLSGNLPVSRCTSSEIFLYPLSEERKKRYSVVLSGGCSYYIFSSGLTSVGLVIRFLVWVSCFHPFTPFPHGLCGELSIQPCHPLCVHCDCVSTWIESNKGANTSPLDTGTL